MKESAAMTELREIREKLSLKYCNMTFEERVVEHKRVREQVEKEFGLKIREAKMPERLVRPPVNYAEILEKEFQNMTVDQVCEAVAEYKVKHNIQSADSPTPP